MGFFFGRGNGKERKAEKLIEKALQAEQKQNYNEFIRCCNDAVNWYDSGKAALMLAELYWRGEYAGEYSWAYLKFIGAIRSGSEKAEALFEEFKEETIRASLEQFHVWYNTLGYEVAESYAELAAKCGSEEAKTMLKVMDRTREIRREAAIPYYNEAAIRTNRGERSKEVLDLYVRAAGLGLVEAMCSAVMYYYALRFEKSDVVTDYSTVYYPQGKMFQGYSLNVLPSADMGNLRWIRKALIAGNEAAIEWWHGKALDIPNCPERCHHLFNISENSSNYGKGKYPDALPKLPIPSPDFVYPEGTVTYESVKSRLGL